MDRATFATSVSLLALAAGAAPEWVQLTPITTGSYQAVDGRKFEIDDAAKVIQMSMAQGAIGIDYDHATDTAAKAGHAAPAAGWIEEIKPEGPNKETGLWARVKWTPKATQAIADGEYRFISPSIFLFKGTDKVAAIFRAALTNAPALVMKGLFHEQETTLDKELCAALGLPDTATKDEVLAAIKKLANNTTALCSFEKRVAEAAGIDVSKFTALDETMTVALCAKLKTPPAAGNATELQKQVDDLQKEVALLSAKSAGNTATQEVEAAVKAGKITPKQKNWAIEYCTRDPDGFKKFVGDAPTILSGNRIAPEGAAEDALTPDQIALCTSMGVKPEDFKAELAARKAELS